MIARVSAWSVLLAAVLLWFGTVPVDSRAARGGPPGEGKTEVLPLQKAAPAVVVVEGPGGEEDLRKQIRAKTGVSGLGAATDLFSRAPEGSYGFIDPRTLGMALVSQSPDFMLQRVPPAANAFEVHKLADGSGLLVGFVSKEVLPQLTPVDRPHHIRLALHSNPSDTAPVIAAVPIVKLMVDRIPVRLDPKKADSPVFLDMDLQGTANRKSPTRAQ